jgi:DNA alkylation repair enzyme
MTNALYRTRIKDLWALPYREEKYLAINFALQYENCIKGECIDMYESMLRDRVDPIAVNLVGQVTRTEFEIMETLLRR